MPRFVRNGLLVAVVAVVGLTAAAAPALAAGSWSAPIQLSTPIPPTDVVGDPSVAVNASGAQAAAWYDQAADGTQFVHVRTSANGQTWSAATTLGGGVSPAVALAPDGRAVAVWEGLPPITGTIQASVRPPNGSWSTPVTVSTDAGPPLIGVDARGNAIAVWAASSGIETASLAAGGTWTAVHNLASGGRSADLAVNASGAVIVAWAGSGGTIVTDSGTVLGGFAAPVTVAPAAYRQGSPAVALNDAGQASLVWRGRTTVLAATRSAGGAWSATSQLIANASGSVDTAIDGSGNAVAAFVHYNAATGTFPVYASQRPAGGAWGTAALLSTLNDYAPAPQAVADPAGTVVVAWTDDNSLTLKARTAAPGGGFGAAAAVGANYGAFDLAIAPGHAALMWTQGGATVSGEPVT
jgi:hypothetical protein